MKRFLTMTPTLLTMGVQPALAFANTNAAATLWIGVATADDGEVPLAEDADLDLAGYEELFWTQIKAVGSHGEVGPSTNILSYDTWDTSVIQKAKGMTDAGSPEIELARLPADPGQIALRAASLLNNKFAFKIVRNDAPAGGTPTIIYNRGLVTGPRRPMGRNEDFDLEIFTLGLQQLEIVDDAASA